MNRIDSEKRVVKKMIRLYCRRKEGNKVLCVDCERLLEYSLCRLDKCKFGNDKPTCKKCPVHCYSPVMRESIRRVMRWAGPRMIIFHPLEAVRHLMRELR